MITPEGLLAELCNHRVLRMGKGGVDHLTLVGPGGLSIVLGDMPEPGKRDIGTTFMQVKFALSTMVSHSTPTLRADIAVESCIICLGVC